jgi:hypothetical protein
MNLVEKNVGTPAILGRALMTLSSGPLVPLAHRSIELCLLLILKMMKIVYNPNARVNKSYKKLFARFCPSLGKWPLDQDLTNLDLIFKQQI